MYFCLTKYKGVNKMKKMIISVCITCLSFLYGCSEISTHTDITETSTEINTSSNPTTSMTTTTIMTTHSSEVTTAVMNLSLFGEPGLTPEIFSPGFISTESNFEFAGTFSPDYEYFFFTRRAPEGTNRIYYTKFVDGQWS